MTRQCLALALLACALPAQAAEPKLVPSDASAVVSARLSELAKHPLGALLLEGAPPGFSFVPPGLDAALVERATLVRRPREPLVLIVRLHKPFPKAHFDAMEELKGSKMPEKKLFVMKGAMVWMIDDRTAVYGDPAGLLPHIMALDNRAFAVPSEDAVVSAYLKPAHLVRETATELAFILKGRPERLLSLEESFAALDGLGAMTLPFRPFLRAERVVLSIGLGKENGLRAKLSFAKDADAKDGETALRAALVLAREAMPFVARGLGADAKAHEVKSIVAGLRAADPACEGKDVSASVTIKADLAPFIKLARMRSLESDDANNLKQLVLAFHNHEATFGKLPAQAICDKAGKPLLSWRVAILPYLEQTLLYEQFKKDEPWDSPHNKKLIPRMPRIYLAPGRKDLKPGETPYQVFTGRETPFDRSDLMRKFITIADGLSNTVAIAEAAKGVAWTRPEDLAVTEKELPKLGGQFPKWFHAAMFDGSVRKIRRDFDPKAMRLLIDPNDGMPTPTKGLDP
ncbi:MAG: DUF1559 domain-containing protein [Gemmataceae bacterium]|nr:DUF1559 domain-containing protein [Gemmataceae bacterium]